MYKRAQVAHSSDLDSLKKLLDLELEKIEKGIVDAGKIPALSVEPTKPREGDVAIADGTNWDPGAGQGVYTYYNGTWNKNQEAGDYQPLDDDLTAIAALSTQSFGRSLLTYADASSAFDALKQLATTSNTGVVELATSSEVWAATSGKVLDTSLLASAAAFQSISPTSWSWLAGQTLTFTLTGNVTLAIPSNGIVGQYKTLLVGGDSSTPRTLSFASGYRGDLPTLADITDSKLYLLTLFCWDTSTPHFILKSTQAYP